MILDKEYGETIIDLQVDQEQCGKEYTELFLESVLSIH